MHKPNLSRLALLSAASVIGLASAAAFAQQTPLVDPQTPPPSDNSRSDVPRMTMQNDVNAARFSALDTDGDGYLNKDEAMKDRTLSQSFAQVDADGDGKISRAEFDKHA